MTTRSRTGAPPFPSISVPPSITTGVCANACMGSSARIPAKQRPSIQFVTFFITVLLKQSRKPRSLFSGGSAPGSKVYLIQCHTSIAHDQQRLLQDPNVIQRVEIDHQQVGFLP